MINICIELFQTYCLAFVIRDYILNLVFNLNNIAIIISSSKAEKFEEYLKVTNYGYRQI